MCTQTENEIIEVEEPNNSEPEVVTEPEPRDIDTLLGLGTYQGMTDAEIDIVLAYRIDRALFSSERLADETARITRNEQLISDNRAAAQRALDMVESLIRAGVPTYPDPEPQIVSPNSITPIEVEV